MRVRKMLFVGMICVVAFIGVMALADLVGSYFFHSHPHSPDLWTWPF